MTFCNVTYDLRAKTEPEYKDLWDELARHDSVKYQDSAYYVATSLSQAELFRQLLRHVHDQDFLSVTSFVSTPSWNFAHPGTKNWIKKHFP